MGITIELNTILKKIHPCNMEYPFVFISYSSKDKCIVWRDVLELQQRGYNVWLDEVNLDKSKSSWKEDALKAIEHYNCSSLLFYVSRYSLVSEACFNELHKTMAEETKELHFGPLSFIAIDAERIGHIGKFTQELITQIRNSDLNIEDKSSKTRILSRFVKNYFKSNNERVRIHFKDEIGRISDYYDDIEIELNRLTAKVKYSVEKNYRRALDFTMSEDYSNAEEILKLGVKEKYVPSLLFLAHLYYRGADVIQKDVSKALQLWNDAEHYEPSSNWFDIGVMKDKRKFYSEALSYYLAAGEKNNDAHSLFFAGRIWVKKGCRIQALKVLQFSAEMGWKDAQKFLNRLYAYENKVVRDYALKDEAAIE